MMQSLVKVVWWIGIAQLCCYIVVFTWKDEIHSMVLHVAKDEVALDEWKEKRKRKSVMYWRMSSEMLENVENLEDWAIAEGTRASIKPQFPGTHPAKSVTTWDEGRAFLPSHAHAAHRIISHNTTLLLLLFLLHRRRLPSFALLQQPHQGHPPRRPRRPRRLLLRPPDLPLGRKRRRQVHTRPLTRIHAVHTRPLTRIRFPLVRLLLLVLFSVVAET